MLLWHVGLMIWLIWWRLKYWVSSDGEVCLFISIVVDHDNRYCWVLPVFAVIIRTLVTSSRRLQQRKDCSSFQRNWDGDEAAHYYSITGLFREIGIGAALTKRPPFTIPLSCCRWDDDEDGDHYDSDDGDDDDDSSNGNDDDPFEDDLLLFQEPDRPRNLASLPICRVHRLQLCKYVWQADILWPGIRK